MNVLQNLRTGYILGLYIPLLFLTYAEQNNNMKIVMTWLSLSSKIIQQLRFQLISLGASKACGFAAAVVIADSLETAVVAAAVQ